VGRGPALASAGEHRALSLSSVLGQALGSIEERDLAVASGARAARAAAEFRQEEEALGGSSSGGGPMPLG